ncbi:MAG: type II/IV secretion system protein [Candidatus Moranbacteria bacterium]|nr:type II/IV secretion system protein [Candidatus Moranbacteria bacterium]
MPKEVAQKNKGTLQRADDISALSARAKSLGISLLSEAPAEIDKTLFSIISEDMAKRYGMVPFRRVDNVLSIAMINPQDFEALNALRFLAEKERLTIDIYLVSEKVFLDIVKHYTGTDTVLKEAIFSLKKDSEEVTEVKEKKRSTETDIFQDAPIAKLVEVVIKHALDGRASDIHIEPIEESFRVRFRVDGILRSQLVFPLEVGRAVISRIKILSNLKIDEKRKPQDGRFRFEMESGKSVDLRVSSLPVIDGEKIVMRVLDKTSNTIDLEKLGLWGHNREILESRIRQPFGIILITGPTGSGKSTTLYSFLQILNKEERNIITLEDPVEYYVEGVNQSQVKPEIGYTFASGLRSILRQDPNVIMVGEIRDSETAELAIHAALTGHLVLSTLHTNSAIGAIPRLIDMNVEPFLLASSFQAVAAQRLVRCICENCREEFVLTEGQQSSIRGLFESIPDQEKKAYNLSSSQPMKFYQGKGCEKCGQSGFRGRIALYEALEISEEIRAIITDKRGNEVEVKEAALRQGMMSMKQDGILKALKGITTLSEIERVTEGKVLTDEG